MTEEMRQRVQSQDIAGLTPRVDEPCAWRGKRCCFTHLLRIAHSASVPVSVGAAWTCVGGLEAWLPTARILRTSPMNGIVLEPVEPLPGH